MKNGLLSHFFIITNTVCKSGFLFLFIRFASALSDLSLPRTPMRLSWLILTAPLFRLTRLRPFMTCAGEFKHLSELWNILSAYCISIQKNYSTFFRKSLCAWPCITSLLLLPQVFRLKNRKTNVNIFTKSIFPLLWKSVANSVLDYALWKLSK